MIVNSSSKCRAQTPSARRHSASLLAVLFLVLGAASAGCEDKGVGRLCSLGPADGGSANTSTSNATALECPTQLCLAAGDDPGITTDTGPYCTAECSSDKDCEDGETRAKNPSQADKRCKTGFFCGVPRSVGSLCCKKLCVCKDSYLTAGAKFTKPAPPTSCLKGQVGFCSTRL